MLLVLTETNAFSMNDHSFNTGVLPDSCAEKPSKAWSANHVIQHHHIYKWLWLEMTSQRTHGWETQILDILRCYIYIHTFICISYMYASLSPFFPGLVWPSGTPKSNGLNHNVLFHFWVASIFRHTHTSYFWLYFWLYFLLYSTKNI